MVYYPLQVINTKCITPRMNAWTYHSSKWPYGYARQQAHDGLDYSSKNSPPSGVNHSKATAVSQNGYRGTVSNCHAQCATHPISNRCIRRLALPATRRPHLHHARPMDLSKPGPWHGSHPGLPSLQCCRIGRCGKVSIPGIGDDHPGHQPRRQATPDQIPGHRELAEEVRHVEPVVLDVLGEHIGDQLFLLGGVGTK